MDVMELIFSLVNLLIGVLVYKVLAIIGVQLGIIAAIIAAVTGIIMVIDLWKKNKKMKIMYDEYMKLANDPFKELIFMIPSRKKHTIHYHLQDENDEKFLKELTLNKGKHDIFLRIQPGIGFQIKHRYFGFKESGERKKPDIEYKDIFVTNRFPEIEYFIDWHGCCHLTEQAFWFKDEYYVISFSITTYEVGDYIFSVKFHIVYDGYKEVRERVNVLKEKELKIKVID